MVVNIALMDVVYRDGQNSRTMVVNMTGAETILDRVVDYLNSPKPRQPATLGEMLSAYPADDLAGMIPVARAVSGQLRARGAAEQSVVFDAVAVIADAARIKRSASMAH